ncbi:MAG: eukaryotic translation initiation factor 3 subunit F [archaeon]|nr:eukaryotic translation initiation factor 3 subunit F [archaeon]
MSTDGTLFLSHTKSPRVIVHPVVFLSILDHYLRRDAEQHRVIGTLLGSVSSGGSVIELTNCFAVPHSDTNSEIGSLDMGHHREMLQLYEKTNPNEVLVGWYSTGSEIDKQSIYYHNFYRRELQHPSPVLLTLDTNLRNKENMDMAAYISHSLRISDAHDISLGASFERLDMTISTFDSSALGLDVLLQPSPSLHAPHTSLLSDIASLRDNFSRVLELLDDVTEYVDLVIAGKIPADPKIGRFLEKTVSALPQINPDGFHQMFNNSIQDILMVVYLANLTRTQLALTERHRQLTASSSSTN